VFSGFEKINDAEVKSRIWELTHMVTDDASEELDVLKRWRKLSTTASDLKKQIKALDAQLDAKALACYPTLTADEVKTLVVDHKWMTALGAAVRGELDRVSQALTGRLKELAERYGQTMDQMAKLVASLDERVAGHLEKMGFTWK
jgi:type I restriction enzyme M protein